MSGGAEGSTGGAPLDEIVPLEEIDALWKQNYYKLIAFAYERCRDRDKARHLVGRGYELCRKRYGENPWRRGEQPNFFFWACGLLFSDWSHERTKEHKRMRREVSIVKPRDDDDPEQHEHDDDDRAVESERSPESQAGTRESREAIVTALFERLAEEPQLREALEGSLRGETVEEQALRLRVTPQRVYRMRERLKELADEVREKFAATKSRAPREVTP